jgi:hypothetical protein
LKEALFPVVLSRRCLELPGSEFRLAATPGQNKDGRLQVAVPNFHSVNVVAHVRVKLA